MHFIIISVNKYFDWKNIFVLSAHSGLLGRGK